MYILLYSIALRAVYNTKMKMDWLTVMGYLCHKRARIWFTSRSIPHSWLITGIVARVTRRVPLVEQELLTLSRQLSSSPVFSGIRISRSLVFYVVFFRSLFITLSIFWWPLCSSVRLRFTNFDYPFGIF